MKLAELIADGTISVEELAKAQDIIERAKFVEEGLEACKKTITFPMGKNEIKCYSYMDSAGEYQAWGNVKSDGTFTCSTNWGGNHIIGRVNLFNSTEVILAFENNDFKNDLKRFLDEQIEKAKKM